MKLINIEKYKLIEKEKDACVGAENQRTSNAVHETQS